MVHRPCLQPFEDVNKRVSRLAANIPRVEQLRDVFVWAYERSCQHYVAVRQNLVPPDIFRLRHRQALAAVVATIVRQGEAATAANIRGRVPASVALPEQDHFIDLVLAEFAALHAGNAVRFGLRPLEFSAWRNQHVEPG